MLALPAYGAETGTHDDMVVVVALAAWWAERRVKLTRA